MNEPTDEELDLLATSMYWDFEYGRQREAIWKLRKLIQDTQERERERRTDKEGDLSE